MKKKPEPTVDQNKGHGPRGLHGCEAVARYGIGRVTSAKLLGGLRELEVVHEGGIYRLRVTSTGKLILTK
jgi:hemin uptake protein HemP